MHAKKKSSKIFFNLILKLEQNKIFVYAYDIKFENHKGDEQKTNGHTKISDVD